MKSYLMPAIKMTMVMLVICCVFYFGIVYLLGKLSQGGGNGEQVVSKGRVVGYRLVGQKFTDDKYFNGRPSGVDYNAAGSGGSNKGASNKDYLKTVQERIDSFLVHNPGIDKKDIPAELVTASGSGLDPDLTPAGAYVQVKRIAAVRNIPEGQIKALIERNIRANPLGPDVINVLMLNVALDSSVR